MAVLPRITQQWAVLPEQIADFVRLHAQRHHLSRASMLDVPEFAEGIDRLRHGDPEGAEWGIAYLEADPWHFRSGYLKASVSRYLRRSSISERQAGRLRQAIARTLEWGPRKEFGETRKLARRLDTQAFRHELLEISHHPDPGTAQRAALLIRSCELNDVRGDPRGAR